MTTAPTPVSLERSNYLTHTRGIWSWLFTLDHKRIGVMYLVSILSSFLLGACWPCSSARS